MTETVPWAADWVWGVPILVLTVLIHSFGLLTIRNALRIILMWLDDRRHFFLLFGSVISSAALALAALHAFEAGLWAIAYLLLGAMTDPGSATLYSLEAMTTYGHSDLMLAPHWRMMGAIEALNGVILFGSRVATTERASMARSTAESDPWPIRQFFRTAALGRWTTPLSR